MPDGNLSFDLIPTGATITARVIEADEVRIDPAALRRLPRDTRVNLLRWIVSNLDSDLNGLGEAMIEFALHGGLQSDARRLYVEDLENAVSKLSKEAELRDEEDARRAG